MIDQNSQFMAILTAVGEAKQANANVLGVPWIISQMGVGDANGADPVPSRTQTSLINERRRAPLNQLKIDPDNSAMLIAEQVIPEQIGGFWIREIGLYDEDDDLVAVANCPPTFKPELSQGSGRTQVVRLNILVSSTQNIQLKIDPSVVLATRNYVDGLTVRASKEEAEKGTENSKLMTPKLTAEAIAALGLKLGTAAGTACEGNDARLANARDWNASVVSQAEAEAGIATIERKWTAQRIRQAIEALAKTGLGDSQSWQDVKENRANGVVYTNTTGQPIQVAVTVSGATTTASGNASFYVDGVRIFSSSSTAHSWDMNAVAVVPAGATYKAQWAGTGVILRDWVELR